jgi:NUDIX domain
MILLLPLRSVFDARRKDLLYVDSRKLLVLVQVLHHCQDSRTNQKSGERVEDGLKRELKEETNLDVEPKDILGVYSDPSRDPRGHRISITFLATIKSGDAKAADDAESIEWLPINEQKDLAFDHNKILKDYRQWKQTKGTYWSSKV